MKKLATGTRIVCHNQGKGWSRVTVDGKVVLKVRTNGDALVKVSDWAKAQGARGVNWGACSSRLWVGFTF